MSQTFPPKSSMAPSTARSRWTTSASGASSPRPAPRRTQKVGSEGKRAAGCRRPTWKVTRRVRASSRSFRASMACGRVG
eukprot:7322441-Alexandrium_andersonii.AAC.1